MRNKLTYFCSKCKMENYIGDRNRTKQPEKMEVQKYCSKCNAKTMHKEKSKK